MKSISRRHGSLVLSAITAVVLGAMTTQMDAATVVLSGLDISLIAQEYGSPHANLSVDGNPLKIGGQTFDNGIGTHANSTFILDLGGRATNFTAMVGIDDEVGKGRGSVVFKVIGDAGKVLFTSKEARGGDAPQSVDVDVTGVRQMTLVVDGGDSISYCHGDWANAKIETQGRARIRPISAIKEDAIVQTPKPAPTPRINSSTLFGVRPGAPFLYTVAATGDRPMTFSASGLPKGLKLDKTTGVITGMLSRKGDTTVTLTAKNSLGTATKKLKIECGPTIGLTPALGWNSWNCFASAVSAEKVKAAADAMVASGLINHGWTYINIDDYWEDHRNSQDPTLQGPHRDAAGKITPNPRFPDMKGLAEYVHDKGLKIGLYSSPGPWTCGGCVASYQHELQDAQSYADWGFDYLKYDWCSYNEIDRGTTLAGQQKPYQVMRAALDQQHRDILFSFCQYGMGNVWEWGAQIGGNSWRTTGDINDSWNSMAGIGFKQNGHEKYSGPGHFNDPDMLVVGKVGWGPSLHPTHLTPNEQYTHISLWCLLASPLLIGCDMTQFDEFTLNLLSNDEVIEVDQDPLGHGASRVAQEGDLEVWAKDMADGSKAVGLFNRGYAAVPVTAKWADLHLTGKQKVRNLWQQKDLGNFADSFTTDVPRHGVVLVRVWPAK